MPGLWHPAQALGTLTPAFCPQLEVLSRLLALAQPDALRHLALARGPEQPQDAEWEVGARKQVP